MNIPTPQSWPNCDKAIYAYINGFVNMLKGKLTDNLVGIYLHGSLAMNSYFPPKSDMDFIIVTFRKLDPALAEALNMAIARYAEIRPTIGCIECSVIILNTVQKVPEPTPYELHYSEMWHERILNGTVKYGTEQFDSDLPAHLMSVKKRGICLYGMAIDDVFGEVSWQSFLMSVMDDFNWIVENVNICESPYYGVLNICRVLQMITERNDKYLSKYEGAIWGIRNLPSEYKPLIRKALEVYASDNAIDESERKTGGVEWDNTALMAFRNYAKMKRQKYLLTERCILFPLDETDFNELTPLVTNTEVREFLGGVRSLDTTLTNMRISILASNEHLFTVRLQNSNILIGLVTIAPHHNPDDMEISYMFMPDYWGKGYASEAIKALLEFCKKELGLNRVVSETQTANTRSCHLLEKLGYHAESQIERFGAKQIIYAYDLMNGASL